MNLCPSPPPPTPQQLQLQQNQPHPEQQQHRQREQEQDQKQSATESIPKSTSVPVPVPAPCSSSCSVSPCSSSLPCSPTPTPFSTPFNTPLSHLLPEAIPPSWTTVCTDGTQLTVETMYREPMILRVPQLLSIEECAELMKLAYAPDAPSFRPYRTINVEYSEDSNGNSIQSFVPKRNTQIATLCSADFGHYQAIRPLLNLIMQRLSDIVNLPTTRISTLRRLLRYECGEKFDLHADDYDRQIPHPRGKRLLTCLLYLQTAPSETGGATVFPQLDNGEVFRSVPTPGSAVIFRNFHPTTGLFDQRCMHYAETTNKGAKYAINMYFAEKDGPFYT